MTFRRELHRTAYSLDVGVLDTRMHQDIALPDLAVRVRLVVEDDDGNTPAGLLLRFIPLDWPPDSDVVPTFDLTPDAVRALGDLLAMAGRDLQRWEDARHARILPAPT